MNFFTSKPNAKTTHTPTMPNKPAHSKTHMVHAGGAPHHVAHSTPVVVITDDMVRDMFNRSTIVLEDGIVPVLGEFRGWKRTRRGLLGAVYENPNTKALFLFAPDLRKQGTEPICIARIA